ncbi:hypothetical protein C8Q75DRAFT_91512 [Abortiporus biennis]|nr:hypothetical protein C8Q75DRAFT_91512 [Abortiporus biennis]
MGVIKSQPFDFIQEPHYLLLAVAALKAADLTKLGISPFIKFPDRRNTVFGSYRNALLELPRAQDADDNPVADENVLRFKVDISNDRDLFNAYGAIGRGTTVFPIRAIQVANNLEKGRTRARTSQKQQESMEALVAKMSWPAERRKSEDGYIRAIRQKLQDNEEGKKYVRNIVELKYSLALKMDAEELKFPRGLMKTFKEQSVRRIFRVLILKRYEPLERIRRLAEFKKIYKELVTAHYWVYTVAKILHRDLSITNMMFLRIGDEVIGILNDWDLAVGASTEEQKQERRDLTGTNTQTASTSASQPAQVKTVSVSANDAQSQVENSGEDKTKIESDDECPVTHNDETNPSESQKHILRTGTGPFMAVDLLHPTPPSVHLYRHDLESFFYVLVWFVVAFNPRKHIIGDIITWKQADHSKIHSAKLSFLQKDTTFKAVLQRADPQYQPLINSWIRKLRGVFAMVVAKSTELEVCESEVKLHWENEDYTEVQWTKLDAQINDAKKMIEELATYKSFMETLEDPHKVVKKADIRSKFRHLLTGNRS